MPCSRSESRPSVSSARSMVSSPRRALTSAMCASWSARISLESYSSRPISVDLPSSTDPHVTRRTSPPAAWACAGVIGGPPLEVPLPLAVLHRGLRHPVVGAGLAALGDPRGGDLGDDLLERRRRRAHGAGD